MTPASGKYAAILTDPPWSFIAYDKKRRVPTSAKGLASNHYQTMRAEDLRALPVSDWAAKDSVLFMWVVDSNLKEGIALGETWGFAYKTIAFVWDKRTSKGNRHFGMGLWSRKQSEICLLFTRGKPHRISKGVRQVIEAPVREHSRKPEEIYSRVEALVSGPYLEMFARQQRPGWDVWGNETDKFEYVEAAE